MVVKAADPKSQTSELDLIRKVQSGDEAAFRLLYRRYVQKVRSTLFRLTGSSHLNDLTQEVFVRVWRNLSKLKTPETFSAWIYRIAINVAQDALRERSRLPLLALAEEPESTLDVAKDVEQTQLVRLVLMSLDFAHRSVLVLHELEGMTEQDIANALNIPLGTVKSRLFHARAKARALLVGKGIKL